MKNLMKAIALSAALLFTLPAFGQDLRIFLAPPAIQSEVIPVQPYTNAVWQPGYFRYDLGTDSYNWVSGQWVTPPAIGAMWVAPAYQYDNGAYLLIPGRWINVTGGTIMIQPRQDDMNRDRQEREQRQLKKMEREHLEEEHEHD
jgi:hypothetical protein